MLGFVRTLFRRKPQPWNPYLAQCLKCAEDLVEKREYRHAISILKDCIGKSPGHADSYFVLGRAWRGSGDTRRAYDAYHAYLSRDPDDALGAGMELFLLGEAAHPDTMPKAYVTHLFDQFASKFDQVLNRIKYQAPDILAQDVLAAHPGRIARLLDLGCGTGLSGLPYKDRADVIEGVDMSEKMLEKAREKNIYTRLHHANLHDVLRDHPGSYDVIVSTDVFIYIGALEETIKLAAAALKPGGLLGFTVQFEETGDFRLGKDHRYWHAGAYLKRCLGDAGLETISEQPFILRYEHGARVPGLAVLARK